MFTHTLHIDSLLFVVLNWKQRHVDKSMKRNIMTIRQIQLCIKKHLFKKSISPTNYIYHLEKAFEHLRIEMSKTRLFSTSIKRHFLYEYTKLIDALKPLDFLIFTLKILQKLIKISALSIHRGRHFCTK